MEASRSSRRQRPRLRGLDGIAIALGDADDLKVGTNGIAIAKRRVAWVEAGDNAVVVVGAAESRMGLLFRLAKAHSLCPGCPAMRDAPRDLLSQSLADVASR